MSTEWSWTRQLFGKLYWLVAAGCVTVFSADAALAQRGREGGGDRGGGGGGGGAARAQAGGGGGARVQGGGGGARVQAGGGGGVRASAPAAGGGGARMNAPAGGARVQLPSASAGGGVGGGGAAARAQATSPSAGVRTPSVGGGAELRGRPGADFGGATARGGGQFGGAAAAGAGQRGPGAVGGAAGSDLGARIRANTEGARVDANAQGRAAIDTDGPRTALRPNFDGNIDADSNVRGRAGFDGRARADIEGRADTDGRGRRDFDNRADFNARGRLDADGRSAASFRPNWFNDNARLGDFRTTFGNAMNARIAADRRDGRWDGRGDRDGYWGRWGSRVRGGGFWGPGYYPGYYFGNNFWGGRLPIGFGVGYGSWPGGWWGYSPWVGNRPWSYWYGNPGWNTFAGAYGWSSPYYYDYGPQGNIVYSGDYVTVNGQSVGTADEYAQSAAELAMVTEEQMNAPHEWVPLGTFAVATSQDDTNPARVAQLAHDNKQGLISGTIFNKESGNLYTLQGKVDPQTQRVAFTVGKDPNVVMETGLYNLTQNETPVLVHFGPTKTATYLFVRLEEQDAGQQNAAAAGAQPNAPPATDFGR